jgi:plastocyanin
MPEASWTFTAAERGTLDYTCTYHPTMRGTVRVE